MAEVAVATALGLLPTIIPMLNKPNLRRDIESMRSWLSSMHAFMEDNYGRQGSRTLLDLIHKVGQIAYDIEDVVDDFILHSPPYTFHQHQINRSIHAIAHNVYHNFPYHGISEKIADIRKGIEDIRDQSAVFGNRNLNRRLSTNRASPFPLDDEMVGYKKPKAEIILRLVDQEKRLVKIAIDGPPGSGKTTFVNNIYSRRQIQAQFDCHAWICVSHRPDFDKIFQNLLKQLCSSRKEPYPSDDGSNLQTRLRRYLTGKRYIIVLDDVWRHKNWIVLKEALPDSFCGSRVIMTTRYSNLFSICASSLHDHKCSLLGLESLDAWKLFCRRAFPDAECPYELKNISMNIMTRCEGLPLAVVAVAGALAQKLQTPDEWGKFHANFGNEIHSSSNFSPINEALLRSYMDLSTSLKRCFLYMSIFPEDHSIERGRLIRLWVAERFAMATEYHTAEEVAEGYLNELIQRNLIHVSKLDFDGRPRNCRVLNLVLEFIIQKSKDENFASIFAKENTSHQIQMIQHQSKTTRCVSVHDHCRHLPINFEFTTIRSMFLLRLFELNLKDFVEILRNLKLIKVLDMQGAPLMEFPKEMTRFTLMKYLCFRGTKIKSIDCSIERLSYLETLDLKQTDVTELPHQISYLHNLRHLFVYKRNVCNYIAFDSVQGVTMRGGIANLTNLQNISLVKIGENGRILRDLIALTQLRKLGVTGLRRKHGKDLCATVQMMKCIKTLDITSTTKDEYIELEEMAQYPPKTLQRLYLKGRLRKI